MNDLEKKEKFRQLVENKFQIYNSLFMSLPYDKMSNIGMLLPFLYEESKLGYEAGKNPEEIMEVFFRKHTDLTTEDQKIELLFKIIQYIERQVVLYDSIEDAAFPQLHSESEAGTVFQLHERALQEHQLEATRKKLKDFAIKIVFTAHPTQFYPNSVLRILHDLRSAITNDAIAEIDMLLQQLGKTPFVNKEKPSPLDEALSIIFYLRYVYYDTIGELFKKIKNNFSAGNFSPRADLIQLGFWPGGDRDGNPYVTAEITRQVARELQLAVLKSYYAHLKKIRRRLSFRGVSNILDQLSDDLYAAIFREDAGITTSFILGKIKEADLVLTTQHNSLFRNLLQDFSDRVKIFGTHFATLDIRQDSRVHQQIIDEIIEKKSGLLVDDLTAQEKLDWLLNTDMILRPDEFEGITKDTLQNIYNVKGIQDSNGERGMNRYIISNSEDIKEVLNVYSLFRLCGYREEEIKMDIVPLFETMEGLKNSSEVMRDLYELPLYRHHLERRMISMPPKEKQLPIIRSSSRFKVKRLRVYLAIKTRQNIILSSC